MNYRLEKLPEVCADYPVLDYITLVEPAEPDRSEPSPEYVRELLAHLLDVVGCAFVKSYGRGDVCAADALRAIYMYMHEAVELTGYDVSLIEKDYGTELPF